MYQIFVGSRIIMSHNTHAMAMASKLAIPMPSVARGAKNTLADRICAKYTEGSAAHSLVVTPSGNFRAIVAVIGSKVNVERRQRRTAQIATLNAS